MIPINRPDVKLSDFVAFLKPKHSVQELEAYFCDWLGKERHCLFTASGKIAIYLLFKFLNIKGDVVTTPLTCTMALTPILANNICLKFADIDPETFNIDVNSLEKAIDKDTEVVYLVHLGGNPCNLAAIKEIVKKKGVLLIEDCAQALGSSYHGVRVGTLGDYACFSFAKNSWLCGGGMICSDDKNALEEIRRYQASLPEIPRGLLKYRCQRDFIESRRGNRLFDLIYYRQFLKNAQNANVNIKLDSYFQQPDVRHRPSNTQASVVWSQLGDIDLKNGKRSANAEHLTSLLPEGFTPQKIEPVSESVYAKYHLVSRGLDSQRLIRFLESRGIDAKHLTKSHGFYFQTRFDKDAMFQGCKSIEKCINYKEIHDRIVTLPISSNMKKGELSYIAETLRQAAKQDAPR
jgi:dTDP-4-amino-4,6-dideoxygalactose transaminase